MKRSKAKKLRNAQKLNNAKAQVKMTELVVPTNLKPSLEEKEVFRPVSEMGIETRIISDSIFDDKDGIQINESGRVRLSGREVLFTGNDREVTNCIGQVIYLVSGFKNTQLHDWFEKRMRDEIESMFLNKTPVSVFDLNRAEPKDSAYLISAQLVSGDVEYTIVMDTDGNLLINGYNVELKPKFRNDFNDIYQLLSLLDTYQDSYLIRDLYTFVRFAVFNLLDALNL